MRIDHKRDVLRLTSDLRSSGLSRRFELHIETKATINDPASAPFDPQNTPDHSLDTIVQGVGVFYEQKNRNESEIAGSLIVRKSILQVHPKYESSFRQAYMVKVGMTPGEFRITGVTNPDPIGLVIKVYLEARQ